ncbi:MAG: SDR family NAD(P)-dependent oxidoreductase [Myxococcota bacterium]
MILLVTGARSGFGKLVSITAARRGHTVYAGLRDVSTASEQLVPESAGLPVVPVQLDVASADDQQAVVDRILSEHGRIDGLVNNAGVALGGFLEQIDEDEIRRVFDVNVFAPWSLTKRVLPAMRAQRGGSVVMVSSMSGRMSFPGLGVYASSKHALEGLSEAWYHELRHFGIQVTLVEPGAYATDIWTRNRTICRNGHDPESPYAPYAAHLDTLFDRVVKRQVRDAQEVADVIVDVLEGKRRELRIPMGSDAKLRLFLKRFAPERALNKVLNLVSTPR